MGVQGLWELLAPVGRRVSVETLAGKKLAIDASIWMVQFMKAMRDDKGEMVHNAHLLGFFRRICKLLFLRTKPVFVFDGATPALKRRTVAARRRHRDNARAKIRKTAEKLLLNHLKVKRLEELAAEIKKQREGSMEKHILDDDAKGKNVLDSGSDIGAKGSSGGPGRDKGFGVSDQENLCNKKIMDDDIKGKKALDSSGEMGAEGSSVVPGGDNCFRVSAQENVDELLAASLAAEDEMGINKTVLASLDGGLAKEDADDDENEEMIFPIDNIHVDPAVLASLPPSMQLDLLVQMRERVMAENRQKYQKIKKAPTKFSELQLQSYLKTIAFRREIDEIQRSAAGRGMAGVQTSRIASEANREFIFSSSFTGDKQVVTLRGVANSGDGDHHALAKPSTSDSAKCSLLTSQSKLVTEVSVSECIKDFGPDVETYRDENGHVRVSRVRGLGIRMTRDLQRNLDLMEEYEQEKRRGDNYSDSEASRTNHDYISGNIHPPGAFFSNEGKDDAISSKNGEISLGRRDQLNELIFHGSKDAIEISFSEDDSGMKDMDDDNIFMQLVSGGQMSNLPVDGVNLDKSTNDSESDCIWREGLVNEFSESPKCLAMDIAGSPKGDYKENQSSLAESSNEEAGVDWEEGVCQDPGPPGESSHFQDEPEKIVSRGLVEEEADIQEAIRRSLKDFKEQRSSTLSSGERDLERSIKDQISDGAILHKPITNTCVDSDNDSERSPRTDRQRDNSSKKEDLQITESKKSLDSSNLSCFHLDGDSSLIKRGKDEHNVMSHADNIPLGKPSDGHPSLLEQSLGASNEVPSKSCSRMSTEENCDIRPNPHFRTTNDGSKAVLVDSSHDSFHVPSSNLSSERGYNNSFSDNNYLMEEIAVNSGTEQQQATGETNIISNLIGDQNYQVEVSEACLDEEISLLRQEHANLGNEQRILERNADSVSSEMFAECQELLQMFGLPYIIAPMEAEAQCAYMEMTNLVDGVVTDDSDVLLFGARSVFKNIFDDRKYVETYFMKDIESNLGLDREKLIRMALLLGSDYTEGVSGIGIVNAIEVVHAFPEEDGLQKFREWIESPDPAILGKLDSGSNSKRRSSKENNNAGDSMRKSAKGNASVETVSRGCDDEKPTDNDAIKDTFINKHRNVSKNWHIPPSFPSESVINAYTSPQIDESTEPFAWGKPDLPILRKLCWEKFGWTNRKADELLVPVLKEYNKHETQLRLEAFYTFNERFAKIRSQRIKKALKGMTGNFSSDLTDDLVQEGPSSRKKRPKAEECEPENSPGGNSKRGKKVLKQSRGEKTEKETMPSTDVAVILEQGEIGDSSVLRLNKTRGGSRGRGRGRGRGRRSSPLKSDPESTDASDSDDSKVNVQMEKHMKVPEEKLRRSTRPLKQVQYVEEDFGDDEDGIQNQSDTELQEVATDQEPIENDSEHRIEDSTVVDEGTHPFTNDCFSREYLFSGGGFCVDENDPQGDAVQLAARLIQDSAETHYEGTYGDASSCDGVKQHFLEEGSSRDNLFRGGGFCMDESDEQVDAAQSVASPIEDSEPSRLISDISEGPENFGLGNYVSDGMKKIPEPLQDSLLLGEDIGSSQHGQTNLG